MVDGMEDIVIIGYGGHAKSVADSIRRQGLYNIVGYTDIEDADCQYEYLGQDEELDSIYNKGTHNAVIGIGYMGNSSVRDNIFEKATKIGYRWPIIVDPSSVISEDAEIGEGTFIGKNAVVNAGSVIGNNCIINTGAIVEHDNCIGDYSHIAVGTTLCGNVTIGSHVLIGAGATVIQGVIIGDNCIVGANSTVLNNLIGNNTYCGIIK